MSRAPAKHSETFYVSLYFNHCYYNDVKLISKNAKKIIEWYNEQMKNANTYIKAYAKDIKFSHISANKFRIKFTLTDDEQLNADHYNSDNVYGAILEDPDGKFPILIGKNYYEVCGHPIFR